jgi:hypothetical protein
LEGANWWAGGSCADIGGVMELTIAASRTLPMKRYAVRGKVRIKVCRSPLSPMA